MKPASYILPAHKELEQHSYHALWVLFCAGCARTVGKGPSNGLLSYLERMCKNGRDQARVQCSKYAVCARMEKKAQVIRSSPTFLSTFMDVYSAASMMPATVNTPPMMAHVVVRKWYQGFLTTLTKICVYVCVCVHAREVLGVDGQKQALVGQSR
eukprot:1161573-Pelagomonas_calceolata.AAC.5